MYFFLEDSSESINFRPYKIQLHPYPDLGLGHHPSSYLQHIHPPPLTKEPEGGGGRSGITERTNRLEEEGARKEGFLKLPTPKRASRGLVSGKAELLPKVFWTRSIVKQAATCSETRYLDSVPVGHLLGLGDLGEVIYPCPG